MSSRPRHRWRCPDCGRRVDRRDVFCDVCRERTDRRITSPDRWCREAPALRQSAGDTVGVAATFNIIGTLAHGRPADDAAAYASGRELSRGLLVEAGGGTIAARFEDHSLADPKSVSLVIQKTEIKRGQPWQNDIVTHVTIMCRMADHDF
jgi:hypothetical protein